MQNCTIERLTIRKSELRDLVGEIIEQHKQVEAACASVFNAQQLALWHGWQAGIRLNRIKELIGHGDWLLWVESNLPFSHDTARRYMKIDSDNPQLRSASNYARVRNLKPDLQLLKRLKFDTIRKHAIAFVPEKEQPNKDRDVKIPRLVSFLNIVNEYNRLKYRHENGLQEVDFKEAREETDELRRKLLFIHKTKCACCGELIQKSDPWKS